MARSSLEEVNKELDWGNGSYQYSVHSRACRGTFLRSWVFDFAFNCKDKLRKHAPIIINILTNLDENLSHGEETDLANAYRYLRYIIKLFKGLTAYSLRN